MRNERDERKRKDERNKSRQKSVPSNTKPSKVKFWQCGAASSRGIAFTARWVRTDVAEETIKTIGVK